MNNIPNVFSMLRNELVGKKGETHFVLDGKSVQISGLDSIGNLLQEWLEQWFIQNQVQYTVLKNSQEFPDFTLYFEDKTKGVPLDIKAWNAKAGPSFDLGNFESYIDMVEETPEYLFAYYLVFAYELNGDTLTIEDIYLKHIWEMTGPSETRPMTLQVKRGVIYNIRPRSFHKENTEVFSNYDDFLIAIKNQMNEYDKSKKDMELWYKTVTDKISKIL